jgi:flavin reductase (DIM6/NTAB) family NADH-FMN oxidoreductase RutF
MDYSLIAPMMGRLWAPIAAVGSNWQGRSNVQIAVAIAASSIVPSKPRVAVQIYKTNLSHDMIYESQAFALSFLRTDQLDYMHQFGFVSGRDRDKLENVPHHTAVSGSPILDRCWGYMDCRVVNAMDGGDMTCFLGEVLDGRTWSRNGPLWWPEARRLMPAQWNDEWDRKVAKEIALSEERMDKIDYSPWKR